VAMFITGGKIVVRVVTFHSSYGLIVGTTII